MNHYPTFFKNMMIAITIQSCLSLMNLLVLDLVTILCIRVMSIILRTTSFYHLSSLTHAIYLCVVT